MKNIILIICFLLIAAFSSACSQNSKTYENVKAVQQDSSYVVDLKALDYAFAMPAEIPSGWITFRMENMGKKVHNALIMQSTSDLSIKEIRAKIGSGEFFPMSPAGGPGLHSSGHKSDITVHLKPGNYVMICTIVTEDGKMHSELGMQAAFQVTEESSGATKPKADTRIILNGYEIDRTKTFATGEQTVEIMHQGFPYGLHLFHVQDSVSIEKAERQMDGEISNDQVEWLTGAEPIDSVKNTFITLNFSPGEYIWTSYAYVWGVKDRFKVEKGEILNKPIERQKKAKANEIEIKIDKNEIKTSGNIETGRNTFYHVNNENDKHVIYLDRLKEGESKKSFLAWYKLTREEKEIAEDGSWPMLGAYIKLNEGDSATVDIQPGKYLISCQATSENGVRHRDQGEIAEFVVE